MGKWKIITMVLVLIFSLSVVSGACSPAAPKSLDEFYAENTVIAITPDAATSTTAYANRIFAAYWPDVVEGGRLIVKDVPEGDGLVGLNQVYAAEPDGLTMGVGVGWTFALLAPHVAQKPGMEFELGKYSWVGALAVEQEILSISPKLEGISTVTDLKKIKDFRFGTGSPDAPSAIFAAMMIDYLGLEGGKVVPGFDTGELAVALAGGEIDAAVFGSTSSMDWVDSGLARALVTLRSVGPPLFPGIPLVTDQFQMNAEQMAKFKLNEAFAQNQRVWLAPPDMPQDKLQWLRDTFVKVTDNEGFQKQYSRRWPVFSRLTGAELEVFVNESLAQPMDKLQELQEFARQYATAQ